MAAAASKDDLVRNRARPLSAMFEATGEEFGRTEWMPIDGDDHLAFEAAAVPAGLRWDRTISDNNQFGRTLLHGTFLLSLVPRCLWAVWPFQDENTQGLNYGYDRVRFVRPLYVGDQVCMSFTLVSAVSRSDDAVFAKVSCTVQTRSPQKLAMFAEQIVLLTTTAGRKDEQ